MKVFKFGGASVNSIERIQNLAEILKLYPNEQIMIIVSAIGKTTNALGKCGSILFLQVNKTEALEAFQRYKSAHLDMARQLIQQNIQQTEDDLADIFTEVEWMLLR